MSPDPTPENKDRMIRRRVMVGTTSNFAGQLALFAISFLLTPFILGHLGATLYGLWILVGSIVAYGTILDAGIWGSIIKFVAEYRAQGDYGAARSLLSTTLWLYLCLAAVICLLGFAVAPYFPQLFHIPPDQERLASQLLILMSISVGLTLPCLIPLSTLRGLQRYELVNTIEVTGAVASAVATIVWLLAGGGVLGIAVINICNLFLMLMMGLWALHRIEPYLIVGFRGANRPMLNRLLDYSWPLFIRDVANRLQTRTDVIVIGMFLPVSAVAPFNVARRLSESTQTLTRQFMKTLIPLASQLHAEDDSPRLRALYIVGTRISVALIVALSAVLILLAGPILTVWVGAEYATYAGVVAILTLAVLIATIRWPAMAVLQGMARHRILALSSLGAGIANVALSIILVRPLGLIGVALARLIPTTIEYFCVVLPYSLRVTGVRFREVVNDIFVPAFVPAIPMTIVLYGLRTLLDPTSLWSLLLITAVSMPVYLGAYLCMGPCEHERQRIAELAGYLWRYVGLRLDRWSQQS